MSWSKFLPPFGLSNISYSILVEGHWRVRWGSLFCFSIKPPDKNATASAPNTQSHNKKYSTELGLRVGEVQLWSFQSSRSWPFWSLWSWSQISLPKFKESKQVKNKLALYMQKPWNSAHWATDHGTGRREVRTSTFSALHLQQLHLKVSWWGSIWEAECL